jgi:hypothetical protein
MNGEGVVGRERILRIVHYGARNPFCQGLYFLYLHVGRTA